MAACGIIFDLDGTLLDTLADLAASVNRVLAGLNFPTHDLEAFRWFVGDGSAVLITRALPPQERSPERIADCLAQLLADYGRNWRTRTRAYDGIPALIQILEDRNIPMSVVTNKPHRFATAMVAHFFPDNTFCAVFGQKDGIPKKPDPFQALAAAREMGVAPAECYFLGDSGVDMRTALRAGMKAVGAGWGFRPVHELRETGAVHVIDHPLQLPALLNSM